MITKILKIAGMIWASPNTFLGLGAGCLALLTGGNVQIRRGCLEFWGGFLSWIFERLPNGPIAAITLGHVIVGLNRFMLGEARDHEHVHVRQYERWGPFFLPAYIACSIFMYSKGKNPYLDNPFEVEAYSKCTRKSSRQSVNVH